MPHISRASPTRRKHLAASDAEVLQPKGDVALDGRVDGLQLGVLKDESDIGERARGSGCGSHRDRGHRALPPITPPWKCGMSPLQTRSRVDLPLPDAPREERQAEVDLQVHPVEGAGRGLRIRVMESGEGEGGHLVPHPE